MNQVKFSRLFLSSIVFLCFVVEGIAQQRVVTGVVTDLETNPLAGVEVYYDGSAVTSLTDVEGTFSINVDQGINTLRFSREGYQTASATIGIYNTLSVLLSPVGEDVILELSLEDLMNLEVVSASKKAEKLSDAPSNITVVTAKQIREWGSRDIKDVMRRVVGYQVIADRDEWVFASRGNVSDNNQKYLILMDGVRMNSIENFGPGNIIELPNNLSNVKRIEIIRGPGSAVWGADALAGVINIITNGADDLNAKYNAAVTFGEDGYLVGDFQVGEKITDNVEYVVTGSFARQDGREVEQSPATGWPYLNPGTNQYTTLLDQHNPGYMLNLKARVDKLTIKAMTFETEVYNRHFEYGLGREHYLTNNKNFIHAAYDDRIGNFDYSVKLMTFGNHSEYRPAIQGDSSKLQSNIAWRDRGINAAFDVRTEITHFLSVSAGIDYTFTKLGPNQRIDGFNPDSTSKKVTGYWFDAYNEDEQIGGYAQLEIKPASWISLTLGTRADYNGNRGTDHFNLNPRVSAVVTPVEGSTLKAIYNRGYLRPTNFQAASPGVQSETMDQVDVIFMQRVGPVNFSLTGYWQKLNGFILILPGYGFANVGDYKSLGIEFEGVANLSKALNLWVNYAYAQPKGENFNSDLDYNNQRVDLEGNLLSYANHSASGGATYRLLDSKIYLSPAVRYVGATNYRLNPNSNPTNQMEDSEANYGQTAAFVYLDFNIGYKINERFELSVYGDNLLNVTEQTHLTVWNGTVGQYGRHISAKLRVQL